MDSGGLWWTVVDCGRLWWTVVDCGELWWTVVDYGVLLCTVVDCGGLWWTLVNFGVLSPGVGLLLLTVTEAPQYTGTPDSTLLSTASEASEAQSRERPSGWGPDIWLGPDNVCDPHIWSSFLA